jgi:hypothetical protein
LRAVAEAGSREVLQAGAADNAKKNAKAFCALAFFCVDFVDRFAIRI